MEEAMKALFSLFTVALLLPVPTEAFAAGKKAVKPTDAKMMLAKPLASFPEGQAMMAEAVKRVALANLHFKFLDKTYEKDVYATDPFGNKYRVSCARFKATSGFDFRVDVPQFTLNEKGLTISQNIAKINANALKFKFQLGPCIENTAGFGVALSNVNFVYKARPMLSFENGLCKLVYNDDPDQLRVAIGGLNITGVQNDLDKLAKDAVRESMNVFLDGWYGSLVRNELTKVTAEFCGK
jgi:hypothetical protein